MDGSNSVAKSKRIRHGAPALLPLCQRPKRVTRARAAAISRQRTARLRLVIEQNRSTIEGAVDRLQALNNYGCNTKNRRVQLIIATPSPLRQRRLMLMTRACGGAPANVVERMHA
jgi:hypothetical protein